MSTAFDFSACNEEPLRHLGLVQNHGVLIALTPELRISHVSENSAAVLRRTPIDLLGRPAREIWAERDLKLLASAPAAVRETGPAYRIWDLGYIQAGAWVHRHDGRIILELEPGPAGGTESCKVDNDVDQIADCGSMLELVQRAVEVVARQTGYSRVMCYRFLDDFSSEVASEVRKSHLEPFLGLHYPATDIPPQARQLYSEELVRALADVNAHPVAVAALPRESRPLDLTHGILRSVARYHIEYLKNMEVAATATLSIICEGRLWGLIVCHHSSRKVLPPATRRALHRVAAALGAKVESLNKSASRRNRERIQSHIARLQPEPGPGSLIRQLFIGPPHIKTLLRACGIALSGASKLRTRNTPSDAWTERFAAWAVNQSQSICATDCLAEHPVGPPEADRWSGGKIVGALSLVLARDPVVVLIFFRAEQLQQIRWGGDIHKAALRDEKTQRIGPRRSFAEFKQTIHDKSAPWTAENLEAAEHLAAEIRRHLPGDDAIANSVQEGAAELRNLINRGSPLTDIVLESVTDGIVLIVTSGSFGPRMRYANRGCSALLECELDLDGGMADLTAALRAASLEHDLYEKATAAPHLLEVGSSAEGRRNLMVRVDRILEVEEGPDCQTLAAMTFTDVTETLRSHETLAAAKNQAEQASLAKSAFLANMSHEIRTPMNGILGTAQILTFTPLTAEQREGVDLIQRSGGALLTVLNDVLDFSKIEAGRLELESVAFDLQDLVDDVAKLMQALAAKKNIGLQVEHDSTVPRRVVGDPARVRQVLLNLLGNAIKFTDHGRVSIRVSGEPLDSKLWTFHFTVSDTGIGIAAADIPKLFQQFNQVDGSNSRKYGGTGLGLAISKQLIELMGGKIDVTSTLGSGSEFHFDLPLPTDVTLEQTQPRPSIRATMAPGKRINILLAEDNEINQTIARKLINRLGYNVDLADNGREAIEKSATGGYDLILMDCQMPELDGFQATEQIRLREGDGRHTTIIALTANALAGDRQRCLEAGMDDYLSKPIQLEALRDILYHWTADVAPASLNQ